MDNMDLPLSAEQREFYRDQRRAHRVATGGRAAQLERLARIANAPAPARIKVRWDNVILLGVAVLSLAIGFIAFAMFVDEFTK